MLESMLPTPGPGKPPDQSVKMAQLEKKIARLEQEKRRTERLLFLTRKVVKKGPVTVPGLGRPPSTKSGSKPSSGSAAAKAGATAGPSSPTPTGAAAP